MNDILPWVLVVPVAALAMTAVLARISSRAQEARTAGQQQLQMALLAKFSSGEELSRFLASEEGRQFMDKLSAVDPPSDPRSKSMSQITGGLVLLFLGGGFCWLGRSASPFFVPGVICLTIGAALLVASAVTYRLSKKLGLLARGNR